MSNNNKTLNLNDLVDLSGQSEAPATAKPDVSATPRVTPNKPLAQLGPVKQLSVKVDLPTYDKLKDVAGKKSLSHQDILYEAIHLWLRANGGK